jgi:hypothetical protein
MVQPLLALAMDGRDDGRDLARLVVNVCRGMNL